MRPAIGEMMQFLGALATFEIMGMFFILSLIRWKDFKCSAVEFLSLSFFVGMGFSAVIMFIYSLLKIPFTQTSLLIAPVFCAAGILWQYYRMKKRDENIFSIPIVNEHLSVVEKLFFAGIILQVLWVLFLVLPIPVNAHDSMANYALKAKLFYLGNGVPQGFMKWPETVVAHPGYPPLLPFVMTWIYEFIGFNDVLINKIMPVIFIMFLALFYSIMKKYFARICALGGTFILATIPQVHDYAMVIHTDLVLTVFVSAAFMYFILYVNNGGQSDLIVSSTLFSMALLVKNEAIVFVAAFVFIIVLLWIKTEKRSRYKRFKELVMPIAMLAVIALPWFSVKLFASSANSDIALDKVTFGRIFQNIKDIPILLNLFQQEVFGPKKWNIFWVLFFFSLIWKRKELKKGTVIYISTFIGISTLGYFCGYMSTTAHNIYFYANTALSRSMIHFTALCVFYMAAISWRDIKRVVNSG
jgi:4-amino-4-deoxy-L-arabinose transferase-like glycosyltransferase